MAIDPMQGDKPPIAGSTELAQATREERLERLRAQLDEIRMSEFNMTGAQFRIYCKFMLAPNTSSPTTLALTENEIVVLEKLIAVRNYSIPTRVSFPPSTPHD